MSTRLVWTDEFALAHGMGPVAAARESLRLTRGLGGRIFWFHFILGFAEYVVLLGLILGLTASNLLLSLVPPGGAGLFAHGTLVAIVYVNAYASAHAAEIVYFYGLRALRSELSDDTLQGDWVERELYRRGHGAKQLGRCGACGAWWDPADYRTDVERIYCSPCKEPLERPALARCCSRSRDERAP